MPRKPSEIAQFKLRIRESLRRQLESAAARNKNSINAEIANRLRASFEADSVRALDVIVADLLDIRQRFEMLLGSGKPAAAPGALGQTIALLEALRGKIDPRSSPSGAETDRVIHWMKEFSRSINEDIRPSWAPSANKDQST
jgi:hypothetical protein